MTIHITWEGLFACIGVLAVAAIVVYVIVGLVILLRWGK